MDRGPAVMPGQGWPRATTPASTGVVGRAHPIGVAGKYISVGGEPLFQPPSPLAGTLWTRAVRIRAYMRKRCVYVHAYMCMC